MIELIVSGVGLGIVLSFVTGPVFFALIKTSIEKGFDAGASLAGGVLLSDIIYVMLSVYGSSLITLEDKWRTPIGIVGGCILLVIGLYYLLKKVSINYEQTSSTKHLYGYFFKGFLMCIFNPGLLLYWITVTGSIISVTGNLESDKIVPFFGSILGTQFTMDMLKAYYANKLRYKIKENTLTWFNRIAGTLMIIFALRLFLGIVFKH
ncbi:LysE family transporter [Pedobacter sp. HMF7647]|uniref:LysE family transporter n=1 Tax=Hufsiella arboris TaxID=2695275 RepID=A0A7K1Y9X9_9SPHI|nr:LysE family translocator [Hufsiella arboris]MXV51403.1 LysE family transporter [Hufsiella arboris]